MLLGATGCYTHWERLDRLDRDHLPQQAAISAVTLAELAAGVHAVAGAADGIERSKRVDLLRRAESTFDPVPFDASAARAFGRIAAAGRLTAGPLAAVSPTS